jgi:hypothetical protein
LHVAVLWCIYDYAVCVVTRILTQGDWRTRYITLGIVGSFQLTIHREERE